MKIGDKIGEGTIVFCVPNFLRPRRNFLQFVPIQSRFLQIVAPNLAPRVSLIFVFADGISIYHNYFFQSDARH